LVLSAIVDKYDKHVKYYQWFVSPDTNDKELIMEQHIVHHNTVGILQCKMLWTKCDDYKTSIDCLCVDSKNAKNAVYMKCNEPGCSKTGICDIFT
jgi:hypothetical protein